MEQLCFPWAPEVMNNTIHRVLSALKSASEPKSLRALAKDLGFSRRTVTKAAKELEDRGIIRVLSVCGRSSEVLLVRDTE